MGWRRRQHLRTPSRGEEKSEGPMTSDPVAYRSRVRIERVKGTLRRAYIPAEDEPVWFDVHSEIAQHYGIELKDRRPHAATLDYLVAATAG